MLENLVAASLPLLLVIVVVIVVVVVLVKAEAMHASRTKRKVQTEAGWHAR